MLIRDPSASRRKFGTKIAIFRRFLIFRSLDRRFCIASPSCTAHRRGPGASGHFRNPALVCPVSQIWPRLQRTHEATPKSVRLHGWPSLPVSRSTERRGHKVRRLTLAVGVRVFFSSVRACARHFAHSRASTRSTPVNLRRSAELQPSIVVARFAMASVI
ncbi:hypothetical protein BCR44DRAFT_226118 [Catenaria anguillulae PL171]|uniref:Uncharacterized protein n=1 Tax=Catenaria anguillulae PL171 TaxID=765915 RepID=A0A1Y2H9S2_9FUNG|nr:hypothetical protein BCR44DRAFT_226118 [Catenaria anguillulae PL171]